MTKARKTMFARALTRSPGFAASAWRLVAALILALAASGAVRAASVGDTQRAIHQHTSELATVRAKIKAAIAALTGAHDQQRQLQEAITRAEQQIAQAQAALTDVRQKMSTVQAQLVAAQRQQASVTAELAQQRKILAGQLRARYMLSATRRPPLFTAMADPGLAGRLLADYGYLSKAQMSTIGRINQQLAQLSAAQAQIQAQQQSLAALGTQRKATLAKLQAEQDQRAQAITALKAKMSGKRAELDHLRASQKQLEGLLSSLATRLARKPYAAGNTTPFAKLRSRLPWPARGALLARYGALRAGGPLTWKGVWIGAASGSPVRAVARGRVAYVGWVSSYGLIVLLQHGGGYYTLYGHNATSDVKVGESVDAGQQIATAGDTGGYRRNGVYFEIRHDGKALNPSAWLKR
ncbi:MAG TPA: peptidoglycan DD-metalloendopeptidase family protein [Nevskiaceae bacterium]|nr:peptidoglycan DD-metalloendopeptidase family protein [Nevskiaceae bacterium]